MGKIYSAKVTRDETYPTSIDFKVEIQGREPLYIRKCQAYTDYDLNPISPKSYKGQYEIWDSNGLSHQKNGIVLFYLDRSEVNLDE